MIGGPAAPVAQPLPDPALVVLVGASGAGKSTWAAAGYRRAEIVCADALRDVVGSGPHDLDATRDAFGLLDTIVEARMRRGLTTVIDTLGMDPDRRRGYRERARAAGLPAVLVVFETPPSLCRARNRGRDRPVPAGVLNAQLRRMDDVREEITAEGWDVIRRVGVDAQAPSSDDVAAVSTVPPTGPDGRRRQLDIVLQISRFAWGDDPAGWLTSVAVAADEAGFAGLALMDHLIQIPQVGRAWEPIPEPWVTLGLLAGLPTQLRLGSLVSPLTFHHPGRLAKTVATLDALSGGRAFCGVGAGWWDREHAAYGIPFPPAAQRLDALAAGIEVLRALWAPGTKPFVSERVSLPETTCYPRPIGDVAVIVGGRGPRLLRIAARLGDACNVPALEADVDRAVAIMGGKAVTVLDVPIVGRDRDHAATLVERFRGRTPAAAFARRHHAGLVADHVRRYRDLADRGVSTVFLALPDLSGPAEVARLAPLAETFA